MVTVALLTIAAALPAGADEFVHEANVMARVGNHPNVVQFLTDTPFIVDVDFKPDAVGGNSPIYEGENKKVTNPLYDPGADPGSVGSFESISFTLDNTTLSPSLHAEGVIHRDIAARNFLVTTNFGSYSAAPGEVLLFSSDGPLDLTRSNVGPIRWMAPESIRLSSANPTSDDDYVEIAAGSFFTVDYASPVPEPASAALLAVANLAITRVRRRR